MGDFALYFENGNIKQLAQQLDAATRLDWKTESEEALKIAERFNIDTIISQWKRIIDER
jgi:hypothetical protein